MKEYLVTGLGVALGVFISAFIRGGFRRRRDSWLREISMGVLVFALTIGTWPGWAALYFWEIILIVRKWLKK